MELPGRHDTDQIFIGIEGVESIHFGHIDTVGRRVLIIGVGNTAMDCCRSAKRLGATDVTVIARKTRKYFKASPWELEDAEEEHVDILENHSPVRFVIEDGTLTGMEFDTFTAREENGKLIQEPAGRTIVPCDTVILAIGQENAFPWIERDMGLDFDKCNMPVVDKVTHMSTRPGVFFGGDAAFGPANIIWAVAHGHQAAINLFKDLYHELAGIVLVEEVLPWLVEERLEGSTYTEAYASLSERLAASAGRFHGFVWDQGGREFLIQVSGCMDRLAGSGPGPGLTGSWSHDRWFR